MRKLFFVLGMLLFLGNSLQAQVKTVTGKIISSSDNKPVSGATVTVEGGKRRNSVAAGADGTFRISVPTGIEFMLEISAVGFEPKEVSADAISGDNFTISLKETTKGLNEVVVVGYGTSRKKDLTGAIGLVALPNAGKPPVTGTSQLLEGTVAGVQVTQTNAQPGSSFTVRIR
ncbi:MAG TPA: carboxypeptidase-like regulatory domain-containing protein, partial [Puia sp.]|nr:carboxypeptidase-like regulatory domain-containing protein [Puia sp.]